MFHMEHWFALFLFQTTEETNMADPVTEPAQVNPEAGKEPVTPPAADPAANTPPADPKAEDPPAQDPNKSTVPEKYELKLPEGSLLDASTIEKISTYAREKGLSNEDAQALLDRENTAVASYHEAQMKQVENIRNGWVKTAENDPEIGGNAFKENAELAKRVIDRYFTDDFKKVLNETGFGNHPEVMRGFVRMGKDMADDKFVHAKNHGAGDQKNAAELFYPSMAKQQ
jgi:hypothetical protein